MKVILLDELKGKGHEGDVVEVARGFAVNYLFPNKLAVEASKGNVKQLEARRANIAKRETGRVSAAQALADSLNGKTVVIEAKAGEGGRLFGSVTAPMIEDAILSQLELDIDRKRLDIHGLIKTTGDHVITVKIYQDFRADVTVRVVGEGGAAAAAAAEAEVEVVEEAVVEPVEETEEIEPNPEAIDVDEALE